MPAGGAVTAGVIAAVGIGETLYGNYEKNKAAKAERDAIANRPKYNIPPEVQQALNISRAQSQGGFSDYNTMQNSIAGQSANQISNIQKMGSSPSMSIGALDRVTSSEMKARADLDIKNSIYKSQMEQGYQKQLGNMANEKEKKWNQDVAGKYNDTMSLNAADKQEGNALESQGINTATNATMSYMGAKMKADAMNPGGVTKTPPPTPTLGSGGIPVLSMGFPQLNGLDYQTPIQQMPE